MHPCANGMKKHSEMQGWSAFICSKLTTGTLEQGVKYVQNQYVNFEHINADWGAGAIHVLENKYYDFQILGPSHHSSWRKIHLNLLLRKTKSRPNQERNLNQEFS